MNFEGIQKQGAFFGSSKGRDYCVVLAVLHMSHVPPPPLVLEKTLETPATRSMLFLDTHL